MDTYLPPISPLTTATGGTVYHGISFALPDGYRPLLLDLHVPVRVGDDPVPVVVWIHGGGFLSGDRRYLPETLAPGSVFEALVDAGIAVATIDYRLSGEAHFPAQLDDVNAAIGYLRLFAATLGLDPERIGIWGESAGGMMAALAAFTNVQISAAVLWYPLTELSETDEDGAEARLIGGAPARLPELAAQASAVTHVSAKAPPTLVVHGTSDDLVPFEQSQRLHTLLLEAGARSTLLPVADAGHCFTGYDGIQDLIAASVGFLAQELLST